MDAYLYRGPVRCVNAQRDNDGFIISFEPDAKPYLGVEIHFTEPNPFVVGELYDLCLVSHIAGSVIGPRPMNEWNNRGS